MWLDTSFCYQNFLKKCRFHTLWWDFTKTAVFVSRHSARQREKYKRTLFSHIGVGEAWAHSAKGTSSFVYEVSNSEGQNWNWQMCHNHNISLMVLVQMPCLNLQYIPVIQYAFDRLFLWSGPPYRLEWAGIQVMSSWWSYSPTRPIHSLFLPCMESQWVNHWPSRESLVRSW